MDKNIIYGQILITWEISNLSSENQNFKSENEKQ